MSYKLNVYLFSYVKAPDLEDLKSCSTYEEFIDVVSKNGLPVSINFVQDNIALAQDIIRNKYYIPNVITNNEEIRREFDTWNSYVNDPENILAIERHYSMYLSKRLDSISYKYDNYVIFGTKKYYIFKDNSITDYDESGVVGYTDRELNRKYQCRQANLIWKLMVYRKVTVQFYKQGKFLYPVVIDDEYTKRSMSEFINKKTLNSDMLKTLKTMNNQINNMQKQITVMINRLETV